MSRDRLAIAVVALLILLAASACGGGNGAPSTKASVATAGCAAARVHYRPYAGMQKGLRVLPWIAASPPRTRLVGHLFYYPAQKVWERKRLARFRIYSGGQSTDGRFSMKILWELRGGRASLPSLFGVRGKRLDGAGSFSQLFEGKNQFPSIVDVPAPGCWRLTLRTGETTGRVTVIALSRK